MANFTELVKYQKSLGKGNIGALRTSIGQKSLEKLDPRNYLFSKTGLTTTLFPFLKGYQAKAPSTSKISKTISPMSPISPEIADKISSIDVNTKITAKNSIVLPALARDMNVMRLNIQKLVRISGESPSRKSDMFFKRASEREELYESQFKKNKDQSKVTPVKKEDETKKGGIFDFFSNFLGSILGLLVKGGIVVFLIAKLGELIKNLVTDKEFRDQFFKTAKEMGESLFGKDIWENLLWGVGAVAGAFVAFKGTLFLLTKGIEAILSRLLGMVIPGATMPTPGVPGAPGKKGKTPKGKTPKGKTPRGKGRFGLLATALGLGAGGLLGYNLAKDEEDIDPETGMPKDAGMTGMEGGLTGAAAGLGVIGAKAFLQPKLDARVQAKTGGPVTFNEKTQRYMRGNKMISAKELPLHKTLDHLRTYYSRVSKVPGLRGFLLKKIALKFGMGATLRIGTFLAGLIAAPFTAGLSAIISLASWGLAAYTIYEVYDWLFGKDNNAENIEKAFELEQKTKKQKEAETKEDLSPTPVSSLTGSELGMDTAPESVPIPSTEPPPTELPKQEVDREMRAMQNRQTDALRRVLAPSAETTRPTPVTTPGGAAVGVYPQQPTAPTQVKPPETSKGEVSDTLVNFVKSKEGFSAKAVWDYQQYSNGYGTKAKSQDEVIDEAEAERRLRTELEKAQKYVIDYGNKKGYNWNQSQIDGLTSFIYNLGPGALGQVTNNGSRTNTEIAQAITKYNKAGGKELAGLTARRNEELAMFNAIPTGASGTTQLAMAPTAEQPIANSNKGQAINVASAQVADAKATQQPIVVTTPPAQSSSQAAQPSIQLASATGVVDNDFAELLFRRTAEGAVGA